MNKVQQENQYRFFCTTDPATWETYEQCSNMGQHLSDLQRQPQPGNTQGRGGARGRLEGGKKGEGGGTGQKKGEKGEESRTSDNVNGSIQTEAPRFGNASGVRGVSSGGGNRLEEGSRAYRQEKGPGPSQTTLNKMWKGKEKEIDMRSWSQDIEASMCKLEKGSPSPLAYV